MFVWANPNSYINGIYHFHHAYTSTRGGLSNAMSTYHMPQVRTLCNYTTQLQAIIWTDDTVFDTLF